MRQSQRNANTTSLLASNSDARGGTATRLGSQGREASGTRQITTSKDERPINDTLSFLDTKVCRYLAGLLASS